MRPPAGARVSRVPCAQTVPFHNGAYLADRLAARGVLLKLETLQVADPKHAHRMLFTVSPYKERVREIVRAFIEHVAALPLASQ